MTKTTSRSIPYGMRVETAAPFGEAVESVRNALAAEGFGVLTEIDVKATLKSKLDVDVKPYVILGACNSPLAHRALAGEPEIGLLLPCNVIVYEDAEDGKTIVAAIDPVVQMGTSENAELKPVAEDVLGRLRRVVDAVAS